MTPNDVLTAVKVSFSVACSVALGVTVISPLFDETNTLHQQLKGALLLMGYTGHPAILLVVAVCVTVAVWGVRELMNAASTGAITVVSAEKPKNDDAEAVAAFEDEKPKREYRLGDDGELIEVDYEGE